MVARLVTMAVGLAALAALAGCAGPAGGARADTSAWVADGCDPRGAHGISGNAPLVPGLQGSELDLARNVAAAFGDPLTSDAVHTVDTGDGAPPLLRYNTTGGYVQVQRFQEGGRQAEYATFHGGYLTEDVVRDALRGLGASLGTLEVDSQDGYGTVRQRWEGQELQNVGVDWSDGEGDPAEDGWWGAASVQALHLLPARVDALPGSLLRGWAEEFGRCALAREGATEAAGFEVLGVEAQGYAVREQSLALNVGLTVDDPDPRAHCSTTGLVMQMDLETGAVIGSFPYGCM